MNFEMVIGLEYDFKNFDLNATVVQNESVSIYLTTLSVAETIWHQMKGWYLNNELERMWKEAAMA
jgi:hypothetical protein